MADMVSSPDAGGVFIYLHLTALALCRCVQAFSSCSGWRLLSSCGTRASSAAASLGAGTGSGAQGRRQPWLPGSRLDGCGTGLSCLEACGIFPDQGSNSCLLHRQIDSLPLDHQEKYQVGQRVFQDFL